MNRLLNLWRMYSVSGFSAVYKTFKIRLKRLYFKKNHTVLQYKDTSIDLPLIDDVTYIKCFCTEDIPIENMVELHKHISETHLKEIFSLFDKNATFWLITFKGCVIGYWWSSLSKFIENWYIPLDDEDMIFFGATIFPEWRGNSISPAVLNKIIKTETSVDTSVFLDVETWNDSALKAWIKVGFVAYGTYPPIKN